MTIADLHKMEAALARRLLPWIDKATAKIKAATDDAHAHTLKALTDAARTTQDGWKTARRFQQNPSYQAALNRLSGLRDILIGPGDTSLDGLIRDARAAFYADSIELWTPHVEPEYRITPEPAPTVEGERLMRSAIIHGYDLAREVDPAFSKAKTDLFAVMNRATRKGLADADANDLIGMWARQSRDGLIRKAAQVLSDSDKAIHEATGWLILKPEFRGERMLTTGGIHF